MGVATYNLRKTSSVRDVANPFKHGKEGVAHFNSKITYKLTLAKLISNIIATPPPCLLRSTRYTWRSCRETYLQVRNVIREPGLHNTNNIRIVSVNQRC